MANSMASDGVVALLLWYFFNIGLVIMNKAMFKFYEFVFPMTLTFIHMLACWFGGYLVLKVFKLHPFARVPSQFVWHQIAPLGLIFVVGVVLGNISLEYIPVSFNQVIKSSVPAFTIVFDALGGRKSSSQISVSILFVVGGVMMASLTEINFNWNGFIAALFACVCTAIVLLFFSASQAVLSSYLMSGSQKLTSPNLVFYISRVATITLVFPVAYKELSEVLVFFSNLERPFLFALVLLLNASMAYLLNWSTFYAISKTSSLTYTVAGNFKVVLSIIISVLIFHNEITMLNAMGCAVTICGVAAYNHIRYKERTIAIARKAETDELEEVADKV